MMIWLESRGAIAEGAVTVKRALNLAETGTFHCGILDLSLRDELVFPVAEALKQKGAGIVFYTGHTGHADVRKLKQNWPEAHIHFKPAPPDLLLQSAIASCLPGR
jgi:CheY-like chemotaxis protein